MSHDNDVDPRDFAFYERVAGRVAADQIVATYLDLTAKAFDACVHGFTGGRLSEKEGRCIGNVTKKYLAHHGRVTARCVLRARARAPCVARAPLSVARGGTRARGT